MREGGATMRYRRSNDRCAMPARLLALASITGVAIGQVVPCQGDGPLHIKNADDTEVLKDCTRFIGDINIEGKDAVDLHDIQDMIGDLYILPNSTISSLTAKNLRRIDGDFTIGGEFSQVPGRPPTYTMVKNLQTLALDNLNEITGDLFFSGITGDGDFNVGLSGDGITATAGFSVQGSDVTNWNWINLKRIQTHCLTIQDCFKLEEVNFPELESVPCISLNGTGNTSVSFARLRNVGLAGGDEWLSPDDPFYSSLREVIAGVQELNMPELVEMTDMTIANNDFVASEMAFPKLQIVHGKLSYLDNSMKGLPKLTFPALTSAREIVIEQEDRLEGLDLGAVAKVHNLTIIGDVTGVKMGALESVSGNADIKGSDINCTPFDTFNQDGHVEGDYSCQGAHLAAEVDTIGTDENPDQSNPTLTTGLSSGAKAGIGVGVGLGVPLVAIIAFLLWQRRKKQGAVNSKDAEEATLAATATPIEPQAGEELASKEKPAELAMPPPGEMPVEERRLEMTGESKPAEMTGYSKPVELP